MRHNEPHKADDAGDGHRARGDQGGGQKQNQAHPAYGQAQLLGRGVPQGEEIELPGIERQDKGAYQDVGQRKQQMRPGTGRKASHDPEDDGRQAVRKQEFHQADQRREEGADNDPGQDQGAVLETPGHGPQGQNQAQGGHRAHQGGKRHEPQGAP